MLAWNEWNDVLPVWIYLAGYLWFWRYHVGFILDDIAYGRPSGEDFIVALLVGTGACMLWPLTVAGRTTYVLWNKYGHDNASALGGFFPAPAKIESKQEKRERLDREKRRELDQRERDIRAKERELGIGQ